MTIREYLEQRLDYERTLVKLQLDALRELIVQRLDAMDDALDLQDRIDREKLLIQSNEYERRLSVLNHAHEAAVKEQARVLPRENFELFFQEFTKWRDTVNNFMTSSTTKSAVWTAVIGIVFMAINVALILWRK